MPTKLCKPPTPQRHFEMRAICPAIIASLSQSQTPRPVPRKSSATKIECGSSSRPKPGCAGSTPTIGRWRNKLDRESNDDRDFVLAFVNHWADAFVRNPAAYKKHHPMLGQ